MTNSMTDGHFTEIHSIRFRLFCVFLYLLVWSSLRVLGLVLSVCICLGCCDTVNSSAVYQLLRRLITERPFNVCHDGC